MSKIREFNPMKQHEILDIHHMLKNIVEGAGREVCFYNDQIGLYFSPLRYMENVSACFDDGRYFNLYNLLKYDIYLTKTVFKQLEQTFHWDLIEHLEERKNIEKNPIVTSYILFLLHNLSTAQDDSFSMYSKDNLPMIREKIEKLDAFDLSRVRLYHQAIPEGAFVVSIDTPFSSNEGILITTENNDEMELITNFNNRNVYYNLPQK